MDREREEAELEREEAMVLIGRGLLGDGSP
jgi:hypothetical protein